MNAKEDGEEEEDGAMRHEAMLVMALLWLVVLIGVCHGVYMRKWGFASEHYDTVYVDQNGVVNARKQVQGRGDGHNGSNDEIPSDDGSLSRIEMSDVWGSRQATGEIKQEEDFVKVVVRT